MSEKELNTLDELESEKSIEQAVEMPKSENLDKVEAVENSENKENQGDSPVDQNSDSTNAVDEDALSEHEKNRQLAKWYVLHTFSGYENVAKENLEIVIDKYSLQERIFDIVIPMEDVVEEKNGKKKIVSKKMMPGYIMVKMIYGDDIWHAVTRTRGITGFVGPKGRPLHMTEDEIRKMHLEKVVVVMAKVSVNDKVEVLEGALNGFVGTIVSLDVASNKCRVMVEMFGRETPVDLSLDQIRKID